MCHGVTSGAIGSLHLALLQLYSNFYNTVIEYGQSQGVVLPACRLSVWDWISIEGVDQQRKKLKWSGSCVHEGYGSNNGPSGEACADDMYSHVQVTGSRREHHSEEKLIELNKTP